MCPAWLKCWILVIFPCLVRDKPPFAMGTSHSSLGTTLGGTVGWCNVSSDGVWGCLGIPEGGEGGEELRAGWDGRIGEFFESEGIGVLGGGGGGDVVEGGGG